MARRTAIAPPESFTTFGDLLVHLRKRARLTQEELGRAVGYSRPQITLLEKNQRLPSSNTVAALFVPALDLDDVPELAQRLIDLAASARQTRTNLPASVTALIGREQDTARVLDYLTAPEKRLVTLIGPPGIGKTRLSLQAATKAQTEFADGVYFVPLASIENSDLVAPAIVQTLGLLQTDQRLALERLKDGINGRQILIALDNFEQVVEAALVVSELLTACPNLKIIVTSRESLRVPGEWLYPVPPLTLPDEAQLKMLTDQAFDRFSALKLFAERARAVRPDFVLTPENIRTVATICCQLDGLPLAIELIASRIRLMSPQALLTRLTSDFTLHADGVRGVPARQKTLHNAIAWSYTLLSKAERTLLRRLAVFAGGWTLQAAEIVCAGDGIEVHEVFGLLQRLVDKSLVITEPRADETRYAMLETIRQYAIELRLAAGENEMARVRHLAYFLRLAEQAEPELQRVQHSIWFNRLDEELDNLRVALEWPATGAGDVEAGLRLAGALWRFWHRRGRSSEGRAHLARILNRLPAGAAGQTAACARAFYAAGNLAYYQDDYASATALLQTGLEIFRKLEDMPGIANSMNSLGNVALSEGDYESACSRYEESLAIRRGFGDTWGIARLLSNLGLLAYMNNDLVSARSLQLESLALFRELDDQAGIAYTLNVLGDIACRQGDLSTAQSLQEDSADLYRALGDQWSLAYTLDSLADVALAREEFPTAYALYRESLQLFREGGVKWGIAYSLESIAVLAIATGQADTGARLLSAAEALRQVIHLPLPPLDRTDYERSIAALHTQLDETDFATAWAAGRAMTLEQVIELALDERS